MRHFLAVLAVLACGPALAQDRAQTLADIRSELDAYNPLIPDGTNWKATLLIEYPDEDERRQALARLRGVEDRVWVCVGEQARIYGVADEDLERSNDTKTSAVHFLRFEIPATAARALRAGAGVSAGVDHPALTVRVESIPEMLRESLVADLA